MPSFRCSGCATPITGAVREAPLPDIDFAPSPCDLGRPDCPPRIAPGTFAVAEPDERELGGLVLARIDVIGTRYIRSPRRMSGCCGPSGIDGPNLLCGGCEAEVGTESSDCWLPHQVVLKSDAVVADAP